MKRNIFIRMVSLLLCFSMLTPIGASATGGFPSPPVITTNKMHYVDQLFDHDGTDTDLRRALDHWLDMSTKGDQAWDREDSGYLMLEQEMKHQKEDGFYIVSDGLDTFAKPVADTIASGGLNLVFAVPEKIWFTTKFGWAGESAYPYYIYLCEIFLEYIGALQTEMEEIDKLFEEFEHGTDFVGILVSAEAESLNPEFVEKARILKSFQYGKNNWRIKAHNAAQATGNVAKLTGAINSTYQYIQNAENTTLQQMYYMNALLMVTDEYMQMLAQWRDQIDQMDASLKKDDFYESVYKKRPDILAAIDAVTENVVELGKKTAEELAKSDQRMITSGEFINLIADWAETISGIKGIVNGLMGIKKTTSAIGKVTETVKGTLGVVNPIAAGLSLGIGLWSEFGEFDDATAAVTNLKKSLLYLLTNEKDGLLKRYIEDRSDANADAVINALNTMKAAKLVGENLWEEYYLQKAYGIYGPLRGKISSNVRMVFQNELKNRKTVMDFDISELTNPVIAVYKDNLNRRYANAGLDVYYSIDTTILGLYSHTDDLSYKGREIEEPPTLVEDQKAKDRLPKAVLQQLQNDQQLLKQVAKSWNVDADILKNLKPDTGYIRFNDLPRAPSSFQNVIQRGTPQLSQNWENGGSIKFSQSYGGLTPMHPGQSIGTNVETGHTVYIDDKMWLYSCDGLEVILTDEEYEQYQALVEKVTELYDSGIGYEKDVSWPALWWRADDYIDQQIPRIMQRSFQTRKWINSFEMYDASVNYETHKVEHGLVPN